MKGLIIATLLLSSRILVGQHVETNLQYTAYYTDIAKEQGVYRVITDNDTLFSHESLEISLMYYNNTGQDTIINGPVKTSIQFLDCDYCDSFDEMQITLENGFTNFSSYIFEKDGFAIKQGVMRIVFIEERYNKNDTLTIFVYPKNYGKFNVFNSTQLPMTNYFDSLAYITEVQEYQFPNYVMSTISFENIIPDNFYNLLISDSRIDSVKIGQMVIEKISTVVTDSPNPNTFFVSEIYPNPFNPTAKIEVIGQRSGFGTIEVFNLLGQKVLTVYSGSFDADQKQVFTIDGSRLSSGVYWVKTQINNEIITRKMMLMK